MADDNDELTFELSEKGVRIRSKGEGAGRLSNALADLVSPFTESAGLIGDNIRLRRVESTIRALTIARNLVENSSARLIPPPQKFLIQWLENSSFEEDDDTDLSELWAKLLVAASHDYSDSFISYVDLLKKIGPKEAELLRYLAFDTNFDYSKEFYEFYENREFPDAVKDILREKMGTTDLSATEICELVEGLALQFNYRLLYFCQKQHLVTPTKLFKESERSISALEREGAVKVRVVKIEIRGGPVSICWLELTKFGFDFVRACEGQNLSSGFGSN